MAIISANLQFNRGGHGLLDYSSLQTNYSAALAWAQDPNSNAAVGQFIYLAEAETIGEVTYAKGPYVVDAIGEGAVLTPLSKSVAGEQDLSGAISDLQGEVGTLKSGLKTTDSSVNALEAKVNALPASFVTDVKDASGNSVVADGVVTLGDYATKAELEDAIGDIDFSTLATKLEVSEGLALKADASTTYTKDEVDAAIEGVINQIPEAPFQSVVEGDKVLALSEAGVLSSSLSFNKETIDGAEYLIVKGLNGVEIGKVATAEFTVDGMLDTVDWSTESGKENYLVLTFNTSSGKQAIEIDFGKYVDAYSAGEGLTLTNKSFAVDFTKVEAAGAAAAVLSEITETLKDYALAANVYSKTEADSTFVKSEGYVAYSDAEKAKLAAIAEGAEVNVVKEVDTTGVLALDEAGKLSADLSAYAIAANVDASLAEKVDADEGKSLVDDTLITKLGNMVEIKSIGGDLSFVDGALSVDLSGKVDKVEGKGLSTNDFTNELKTKLEGIASGAEVNYIKSVGDNLAVDGEGKLTVDLSAKLDASAKVNGVSFVDGVATLDAGDIALEAAITRTGESGEVENVYAAEVSIQSVLASLSQRIDVLDPNVSGELGITSIVDGNGVKVETSGGQATISVKASTVDGNMAEVKTDGIYVQDMRSYWEAI